MKIDVIDHPGAEQPASPASTIVLVRDGDGEIEVLMIHRGADTAFGGMWAFPGGVIEEADIPDGTAPDPLPAARRAAVRETHEEVGLHVDEGSLVYWSHWLPPVETPRRFSTWFFLAPAGDTHADEHVGVDGDEVWESGQIHVVTAMSVASFKNLIELLPESAISLLTRTPLVTPAERVLKEALDQFPELPTILAEAPDADEMVRGVVRAIDRIPG